MTSYPSRGRSGAGISRRTSPRSTSSSPRTISAGSRRRSQRARRPASGIPTCPASTANLKGEKLAHKVTKTDEQWRRELTAEQYEVLRQKGTESPFTNEYDHVFEDGVYRCAGCGAELFRSDAKYDSGCGWPAFYAPASEDALETEEDKSLFMRRTEVLCATCEGHLGHVFPDGPHPTGLRYCINSAAIKLEEE